LVPYYLNKKFNDNIPSMPNRIEPINGPASTASTDTPGSYYEGLAKDPEMGGAPAWMIRWHKEGAPAWVKGLATLVLLAALAGSIYGAVVTGTPGEMQHGLLAVSAVGIAISAVGLAYLWLPVPWG
jgi:hypothetical protein